MTGVSRLKDICIDCADPWSLSHWWAEVLGYRVRPHAADDLAALQASGIAGPEFDPSIAVDPIDEPGPSFWFNRVSEVKQVKNRVHVDVYGDADDLLRRGATLVAREERWTVVADPEGNEFCVFPLTDHDERSFSPDDLSALSRLVLETWRSGVDRDWTVPAGTLEWSCWKTADHTVDCVFSYAFFLASRRQDTYPPFGELHALPNATPADIVDGLQASTTLLSSVIATTDPKARAVIGLSPYAQTGTPQDFAARAALEMILHAHDVCAGLDLAFDPPRDICARLRDYAAEWPGQKRLPATDDPWSDLLERSGRARRDQR